MVMTFIQLMLMIFMLYLCIYTIVNRVCACIEQVQIAKSFRTFNESNKKSLDEFEKNIRDMSMDDGK